MGTFLMWSQGDILNVVQQFFCSLLHNGVHVLRSALAPAKEPGTMFAFDVVAATDSATSLPLLLVTNQQTCQILDE
jgi:hypothetical protein